MAKIKALSTIEGYVPRSRTIGHMMCSIVISVDLSERLAIHIVMKDQE
jgi:hypothetical protein